MCLVAIALDESRRFPLVVAANRDEFVDRPTDRLGWWMPSEGGPEILGGRDLAAGGTWLGLTAAGRLALVTNVRRAVLPDPQAPSRGHVVAGWLSTELPPDQFWMKTSLSGYAPFNLVAADFLRGDCFWASNEAAAPRRMERGIFGLSNAALDTPWPKVVGLKSRMAEALETADSVDALALQLFDALANRETAPDDRLPATGIDLALERTLSPAFVQTADGRYGTRSATVIVAERVRRQIVTHVMERTFTPGTAVTHMRRVRLADWPPRYATRATVDVSPIDDLEPEAVARPAALLPRTRVRSLLRPSHKLI